MITGLFSTTQTLLSVIPEAGGELRVQHACVRGKKILSVGEGVPSPLTGVTRASVFSLESYFEQVDLAAASVKLLPLVARRHIDAELVFDDALYRLRACTRAKTERSIAADLAAVPERDLEAAVSQLPLQQRPCEQMVPLELAIAALVSQVTDETVLVFWEKGGVLISLLAAGGMV